MKRSTKVLVIDIGGTHVKIYPNGRRQPLKIDSGPAMTPKRMVKEVRKATEGWKYDVISIGYPGPVVHGKLLHDPVNLGKAGWVSISRKRLAGR